MARLYANENFPLPVVEVLRSLGHDVLTTDDAGLADQAVPDDEVLAFAITEDRAVLTLNRRHFVRLHNDVETHAGIIVCSVDPDFDRQAHSIDETIRNTGELRGQLLRVNRPGRVTRMTDLPKQYDPADAQAKWFAFWDRRGDFDADPHPDKPSHTIMIPLPNVTGALHMGHALNGTLQDLVTRWRRMQGHEALWMPGTDHAGIATQAVVERRMFEEEGLTRHDVGREALVNRIWAWKDAYERRIIGQQQSLGASCDWRRVRFTLDDVCSKAVRRTFFKLFQDGLIYRGKRLVNWDVHLQTAVADDEVFEEDVEGHFWTFTYPILDDAGNETDQRIRFSTTRPETMLGDTAVCVHPSDKRYEHLVGKKVRIPLNGRDVPIIADGLLADPEKGTGAVKVTPAHDPNDYACYQRNPEIGVINVLNPDGTMNAEAGEWEGRDRYAVRDALVDRMAELGFYEGVEDRRIPLKHSDRSKTPVEPYLSDQWFVKMDDHADGTRGLAQLAIDAVEDGRVRFYPSRYAKTYLDWLGEKRDWCISRQLWWGHRIPVWTALLNVAGDLSPESMKRRERTHASVEPQLNDYFKAAGVQRDEWACEIEPARVRVCPGTEQAERAIAALAELQKSYIPQEMKPGTQLESVLNFVPGFKDATSAAFAIDSCNNFEQDPDVLDTWFSSALWPHATLGWPDEDHDPPLSDRFSNSPSVSDPSTVNHQPSTENAVLNYFYPGSVLVTSRDIITLWVARMVLTGLYNMGDVPFEHVHVHPKILDGFGQAMSKSKGNGVDPVDLIDKYGTDAVRFTIASVAGETQDVRLPINYECPHCGEAIDPKLYKLENLTVVVPATLKGEFPVPQGEPKPTLVCTSCKQESQFSTPLYDADDDASIARMVSERFEYGRNFCNKLWNASRFALMNLAGYTPGEVTEDELHLEDRWILSRLATVAGEMNEYLGRYQFDAATRAIREFTWNEFCDWYLEMIKPRLRGARGDEQSIQADASGVADGEAIGLDERALAQRVLVSVLDSLLRLLHPFVPFITEELWQRLKELAPERPYAQSRPLSPTADRSQDNAVLSPQPTADAVIVAPWPDLPESWRDDKLERRFERLQETIVAVRNVRAVYNIPPTTAIPLHVRCEADVAAELRDVAGQFDNLAKAVLEAAGAEVIRPPASAGFTIGDADGFVPLEGVIDRESELARQQKEREKLRSLIAGNEKKLSNENFVNKAPADVVAGVRESLENYRKQLESVEQIVRDLGGE